MESLHHCFLVIAEFQNVITEVDTSFDKSFFLLYEESTFLPSTIIVLVVGTFENHFSQELEALREQIYRESLKIRINNHF